MMKRTLCLLAAMMMFLCGCGSKEGNTIIQYGDGVTFSGKLMNVSVKEAGFATLVDSSLNAVWEEDGLYIYTRTKDSIPYVLINYYPNAAISDEQFLEEEGIAWMEYHYGDDLLEISDVKDMNYGGKTVKGYTAKYKLENAEIHYLEVVEEIGGGLANYIVKFEESGEPYTMDAFETALKEFTLLDGSASSSGVEGLAESSGTSSTASVKDSGVKIVETKAETLSKSMKQYNYGDLITMMIPSGWEVSIGGYNMYTWIRAYDPADPTLQVFAMLKVNMLLKNDSAKAFYENYYRISGNNVLYKAWAEAVVNSSGTVREFFEKDFEDYCVFLSQNEATYAEFYYPQLSEFTVLEEQDVTNYLSSIALDNKYIHATFTDTLTREKGEGLFTGTLVNLLTMMDPGYDCGVYGIYNLTGMSAPYGMLGEYEPVLMTILNSIQYTDKFVNSVAEEEQITAENARIINSYMQETMNIVNSGWEARQKSYDIKSQEYSDAALGYDRYLDTETNQVYRVEYGAMDGYDGNRYQKIDQGSSYYTEPVSGYIVK